MGIAFFSFIEGECARICERKLGMIMLSVINHIRISIWNERKKKDECNRDFGFGEETCKGR